MAKRKSTKIKGQTTIYKTYMVKLKMDGKLWCTRRVILLTKK
jgi:hypothetical protein